MKERTIYPTEKQKRVLNNVIAMKKRGENINKGKALLDAGYSEYMSKSPTQVFRSKGFLKLMDNVGLTDENLAQYLAEDIKAKPADRLGELKLAMEVKGIKNNDLNVNITKAEEAVDLMKKLIDNNLNDDGNKNEED